MERIFKLVKDPTWIFTVVVAGLVIGVAASYIRSTLDKSASATSGWWTRKSEARQLKWQKEVRALSESSELRAHSRHLEMRSSFYAILYLLFATLFILLGFICILSSVELPILLIIPGLLMGGVCVILCIYYFFDASRTANKVEASMPRS